MSASSRPTRAPSAASASAMFTAVVLLPTPPLPEATAITFFTFGETLVPACARCASILVSNWILSGMPAAFCSRSRKSACWLAQAKGKTRCSLVKLRSTSSFLIARSSPKVVAFCCSLPANAGTSFNRFNKSSWLISAPMVKLCTFSFFSNG